MSALPLAHLGHWYHSLLYLAPVAIVAGALWLLERREARRERAEDDASAPPRA